MSKNLKGNLILLCAAIIWGLAFVSQDGAAKTVPPFTINAIRSFIGCLSLLPVIFFIDNREKKKGTYKKDHLPTLIIGGIACGIFLFWASTAQTVAMVDADEGKAGFMTTMYLIIVPILGIFTGKKVRLIVWISAIFAAVGLYFLCMDKGTGFSFDKSELLLIMCAFVFSLHILAVDYFSPKVSGVKLSCVQFFVVGCISLVYMVFVDKPSFEDIMKCIGPLLYLGIMSSGVAYTLQIVAQKDTEPAVASIIMSMESLFALLAGAAFSGVMPPARALVGCALMMVAILLVQLPTREEKKNA